MNVHTQRLTFSLTEMLSKCLLTRRTIKVLKQTQQFHNKGGLSVERFVDLLFHITVFRTLNNVVKSSQNRLAFKPLIHRCRVPPWIRNSS
jgi:hypothetical protein